MLTTCIFFTALAWPRHVARDRLCAKGPIARIILVATCLFVETLNASRSRCSFLTRLAVNYTRSGTTPPSECVLRRASVTNSPPHCRPDCQQPKRAPSTAPGRLSAATYQHERRGTAAARSGARGAKRPTRREEYYIIHGGGKARTCAVPENGEEGGEPRGQRRYHSAEQRSSTRAPSSASHCLQSSCNDEQSDPCGIDVRAPAIKRRLAELTASFVS